MKFYSVFSLLATVAFATQCMNEDFDHDPMRISPSHSRRALLDLNKGNLTHVNMYLHVLVSNETTTRQEYDPTVQANMKYLNDQYNKWGFQINLKNWTYVLNADWAKDIDVDKDDKMNQLHLGDYQTLNVYWVESASSGVCSLPEAASTPIDQKTLNADGCFVPMPKIGDKLSGTLTHEVGHWFGLLHVFQGGCSGDGDYCDDTNPQLEASYGKMSTPNDLNSCTAKQSCKPGVSDNTKNYMDYTDCSSEFTPCQGGRMSVSWTRYRNKRQLAPGVQVKW